LQHRSSGAESFPKPVFLGQFQAFSSQSGGGAAVRKESLNPHDHHSRRSATFDDKAFVGLDGAVHDLAELGTGEMSVNAPVPVQSPFIDPLLH
jgi:hypothetical protein